MKNTLSQIEQYRKQTFSVPEIQRLLTPDPETKRYERFEAFCEENASILQELYGTDNAPEAFKKALEQRLNLVRDLLYFRHIEGNLTTRVEKKIERMSSGVRSEIDALLDEQHLIDERILETIRNTPDQDIISGEVSLEEEDIHSYIRLVREELRAQILKIQGLNAEEASENPQQIRDIYEKSTYMLEFIVAHTDISETSRRYLHAFLLRKIREQEGLPFIQELYLELKGSLVEQDPKAAKHTISALVKKLDQESSTERKNHIRDILRKFAGERALSEQELEDYLDFGVRLQGDMTYDARMSLHLEEIEKARFEIELEKMLPKPNELAIKRQETNIETEAQSLRDDLVAFRKEKYNSKYALDRLPEESCDPIQRIRLDKARRFLREHRNTSEDVLKQEIGGLKTREQTEQYLQKQEAEAMRYLCEEAEPRFTREALTELKKTVPDFDMFDVVSDQERYLYREDATEEKPSEYFEGDDLKKIEELVSIMEAAVASRFMKPEDEKKFSDAQKGLEDLQEKSRYSVPVSPMETKDPLNPEDIQSAGEETEMVVKKLPPHLYTRLESVIAQAQVFNKFAKSRREILKLTQFDDETQLRAGLGAFFSEYFEVNERKADQIPKLTKVMSLDHPITSIRFNAADQQPFINQRTGQYQFHTINNEPATYKDRSMALMKVVQQHLRAGEYAEITKLFERGGLADRLYMDTLFFPINTVRSQQVEDSIVYDTTTSKHDGHKVQTVSNKIPTSSKYEELFGIYRDKESPEYKDHLKKIEKDHELNTFKSPTLAEDEEFVGAFEEMSQNLKIAQQIQDAMIFNDDGSVTIDPEKFERIGGDVKGAGLTSPEDLRITREALEKIASEKTGDFKKMPLVAGRAAQLNSIALGYLAAYPQYGVRKTMEVARLPFQFVHSFGKSYWKAVRFFSIMSIYVAITEFYEHIANLADFRMKFKAYTILKDTFKGTIIGSEFEKQQQAKENERVDAFKGAFAQYGNADVVAKLYDPRDRFELKATMIEGFDNRGLFTIEDILKNDFFRVLNRFTPTKVVPVGKYDEDQMKNDPDAKAEMTQHVREALDEIWGGGTWYGWRSAGAAKYESNRKAAYENFNNNSPGERFKVYKQYWDWLREGGGNLPNLAPAELVGNIENDMIYGFLDSGQTFSLFQAMLSMGFIKLEHLSRFQAAHTNDIPSFSLMEPIQAEISGMTDIVKDIINNKKSEYDLDNNDLMLFYQGRKALPLKAKRAEGKWQFLKTFKDRDDAMKDGSLETVNVTVQQIQKWREAQPEWHRKMDNSSIGIFSSAYSWDQIENGLSPNAQGNIDARPHDIVAAYRGIHHEFASYMSGLKNTVDEKDFKRSVWQAYNAICKTQAYAGFLARHRSKKYDYDVNLLDASPNLENKIYESRGSTGISNFEKLILGNTGPHQRLSEGSKDLDGLDISDELRVKFKRMAGYQFVPSLGVDPKTGKKSNVHVDPYYKEKFYPAEVFPEVIQAFYKDVLDKAKARGDAFYKNIKDSLEKSKIADFTIGNAQRQDALNKWVKTDVSLP